MELWVCHLGRVEYREAAALQERLREQVIAGELPELMLLLEHPPVYTVGAPLRRRPTCRSARRFYRERGIDVVRTPRGGQLTYHGPGPARRLPDHARHQRAGVHPHDGARARRPRWPTPASRRTRSSATSTWACGSASSKIASVGVHISHGVSCARLRGQRGQRPGPVQLGRGLRAARGADDVAGRPRARARASRASASARAYRFAEAFGRRQRLVEPRAARHRAAGAGLMDVGARDLPHRRRRSSPARRSPSAPRQRGYESLMVTEHTHIPVSAGMVARDGGPLRREVPAHARPVRGAGVRRGRDREARASARPSAS